MTNKLPCPRFEFRWTRDEDYEYPDFWWCHYALVIPLHEFDIRRGDADRTELTIPIGKTHVGMEAEYDPITNGKVDTPFRDFSHAQRDCWAIGGTVPIVAVYGDHVTPVPLLEACRL